MSLSQQQPHGEPETTQSTENVVSFRMFPKPEDHDATVDKRRDVLESDYENERRNSKPNSESKRSDTYHDVMHDNEYLD